MYSSTGVKKEEISKKLFKIGMAAMIVISVINVIFIFLADRNISFFFKQRKHAEFVNVTATITNEMLEADYRSVRNKLSLFRNTNTFDSFVILNDRYELIDGDMPTVEGLFRIDVPVYYPNTNTINSYISYFYGEASYNHTKKIVLAYIVVFLLIVILTFFYFVSAFVKYLNRTIYEYDIKFEAISADPLFDISGVNNPFSPTLYKLKDSLISIRNKTNQIIDLESEKYKVNLAKKLAHDIRSPVSTLNLISSKIEDPEIKCLQLAVSEQINAIANGLLLQIKNSNNDFKLNSQLTEIRISLTDFFFNLMKEYEFKSNVITQKIMFDVEFESINDISIGKELSTVLYSSLNNFIQNSIEATKSDGIIKVVVNKGADSLIKIKVSDDGMGIPKDILDKLGHEEVTFGKVNMTKNGSEKISGNGIAVYNAKHELLKYGLDLKIESEMGVGTEVVILFKN